MKINKFLLPIFVALVLIVATGCSGISSGASKNSNGGGSSVQFSVTSLPSGAVGANYSGALKVTGGTSPYSFSLVSGALPTGLSLAASTGVVSGKPTSSGNFNFTIQVSDSSSPVQTAQQAFGLVINPQNSVVITTTSLANGSVGSTYSANLAASGGTSPYTWSIVSGSLPAGLSLTSAGAISGDPSASGTFNFTVQVADSSSNTEKATAPLAITIATTTGALTITGSLTPNAVVGQSYSSTAQASGGTLPYTWSIASGQLPPGLTLAATTGTVSGTPTQAGKYKFTLKVVDSSSPPQAATQDEPISVVDRGLDSYGGLLTMPSPNQNTGIFRVEKFANGKWMFVDPDNNGFFLVGVDVLDSDSHVDDMGGDYYDRTMAKYGTEQIWAVAQEQRLDSWGINASGANPYNMFLPTYTDPSWPGDHSNPVKRPFIYEVWPGGYGMRNIYNWAPAPIKNLVNGFSPNYQGWRPPSGIADYYDSNLGVFLQNELANDGYLQAIQSSQYSNYMVGVYSDDGDFTNGFGAGPDFNTQPNAGYNNFHLGILILTESPLDAADSGFGFVYADPQVKSKKALHDMLVSKYVTISALNTAWGSNYTTFDSSGTSINGESVGTGDGSTLTFNKTLSQIPISNLSLQVLVNGIAVAGDKDYGYGGATGQLFGPNVSSGSIDRTTGQLTITFTAGHAPSSGSAITANYVQNGWGYGTGLMDEDFRSSHQAWLGNEVTYLNTANKNVKADLDQFLYQIATQYFSVCSSKIKAAIPNALYFGPDPLGTYSTPSNRQVLKAAAPYVDVMEISGGGALTQAELDFIYKYYGDKPIMAGQYRTANADSALWRYPASSGADFPTQGARGQDYFNTVTQFSTAAYTSSGGRPYVGIFWWQFLDNWGEKNNWGLVSLSDNAYDGNESVVGPGGTGNRSVQCSPPIQQYLCGGEEKNYGDVITPVTNAHAQIMQQVQQ